MASVWWIIPILFIFSACQTKQKPVEVKPIPVVTKKKSKSYSLAFVGDIIIHERLRKREERRKEGYQVIWSELQGYLDKADLSYANLEGPVAPEVGPPTGYPQFNFPEKLLPSLKQGGFDVVSTANNHALDKGVKGARNTIKNLKKYKIPYTGTVTSAKSVESKAEAWWHISRVGSKKIAWLACTEMTNGIKDKENLVLYCFKDIEKVKSLVKELRNRTDISAIILLPHWGEEEVYDIDAYRKRWAHIMLNLGASAVIGSHPHVVQEIENYVTEDQRPTVIAYSLGNFVSNQHWLWTKASMMIYLKLQEDEKFDKLIVEDVKYIPLWMKRTIEKDGTAKFRVVPVFDFKKVPYDASQIWLQQLGDERRLKQPAEVDQFLKPDPDL